MQCCIPVYSLCLILSLGSNVRQSHQPCGHGWFREPSQLTNQINPSSLPSSLRLMYRGPVRPVSPLFRFKSAQEASRCRLRALKIGLCDSRWYLTCFQAAPRSPQDVPKRPRSSANDAFERAKTLKNWCKNNILNIFGFIASTWLLNLRNCS